MIDVCVCNSLVGCLIHKVRSWRGAKIAHHIFTFCHEPLGWRVINCTFHHFNLNFTDL